jgi:L,D-transpeptidase YcbB
MRRRDASGHVRKKLGELMKTAASMTMRVSVVALAAMMVTAPRADAQNIFDMLFGGPVRRERSYPPPPPPHQGQVAERARTVPASPPRVSGPSYYDYKVDSLVPVGFDAIEPAPQEAFAPVLGGQLFREALAGLAGYELRAERDIAAALVAHYSKNAEFVWVSGHHANGKAADAMRVLGDAASHGLDPADYTVEAPSGSFSPDDMAGRSAALIRFEMAMSARVLRYVRDAHGGRVDPNRISGYHDFAPKPLDLARQLDALRAPGADVAGLLQSHHPQGPEYRALRAELELLRAARENEIVLDDRSMFLRPGGRHAELPKLIALIDRKADDTFRGEHAVLIASLRDTEVYSDAMVPLIKAAQETNGLKPDGIIGPRTVEALAGNSRASRMEKVLVALEQRRWLPTELAPRRVFLNAPAYSASYFEDGREVLSMRAIYGTKATQTYFFQDEIDYVEYQPFWGVPRSILVNKYLQKLINDPSYLDRNGFEVTDSRGKRIPSSAIDWGRYGANIPYSVRQRPGGANALGELKIMFPNKHAIYMHDTPDKHLFSRDDRALSNGCVRLADPRAMAAALLGTTTDAIGAKVAQGHSSQKVPGNIPVFIAYFTAWPDGDGTVRYHGDVYDRDPRIVTAIEKVAAVRNHRG